MFFIHQKKKETLYKASDYSVLRQDYEKAMQKNPAAYGGGITDPAGDPWILQFLKKYWAALLLAPIIIVGCIVYGRKHKRSKRV